MLPYQDPALSPEARCADLLGRMTPEEKIAQLCKLDGFKCYDREGGRPTLRQDFIDTVQRMPIGSMYGLVRADWWTGKGWHNGLTPELMSEAVNLFQRQVIASSRWGIPMIIAEEAPHGLMALGCTVLPTGLGMGATFDPELMRRGGAVIGAEGSAAGIDTVYGPILDIARDPRWSRTEEDFGEDPLLVSRMGVAYVEGLQGGRFPAPGGVFSTLKHFAAHGDPEGGHNSYPNHVGPIELRNVQMRPFQAAVAAGARSVMVAYNMVDGVPCVGNHALLTGMLRDEWGFDGFAVADRCAISNLVWQRLAVDETDASALALKAGLDTEEGNLEFYSKGLAQALARGLITVEDLDRAVGRLLRLKFRLGLFERPFTGRQRPAAIIGCAEHRAVALEFARKSITLLENKRRGEAPALPLAGIRSLAVVGPNADVPMNQLGDYTAPQRREGITTVLDGVKALAAARGVTVTYAKGCKVRSLDDSGFAEARTAARDADATILVLGGSSAPDGETGFMENGAARINELATSSECDKESGEGYDRATLRLGGRQLDLLRELKATGKPLIVVLVMGRPLVLDEVLDQADAVLLAWYPGLCGGQAVAEAIFGELNPGGRLPISIPRCEAQLPVWYYSHMPRNDYIDHPASPRLSFGFGLSYTTFAYRDLMVSPTSFRHDGAVAVAVTVENTGTRDGDEVVQLYLTTHRSSIATPHRSLIAFRRIHLKAGGSERVIFPIGPEELRICGQDLTWRVEPGERTVAVGGSLGTLTEARFTVSG